jgi:hypothetical protein
MNAIHIVYPAIAMFALSMGLLLTMGFKRYRAIQRGDVRISFFSAYDKGSQPERLHIWARHIQNHFEVPPLFYVAVVLLYSTNSVSLAAVVLAWLFVVSRCVHSYIHLGSNNVSRRFFTFGLGLLMVTALWTSLFIALVSNQG